MTAATASYETVIGLEVHVQLVTHSKAFCGDDASFGGGPNTHVGAISLGHPGTLPMLNRRQVEFAVRLGPPEYFMLMVLAFTTVSAVLGRSTFVMREWRRACSRLIVRRCGRSVRSIACSSWVGA